MRRKPALTFTKISINPQRLNHKQNSGTDSIEILFKNREVPDFTVLVFLISLHCKSLLLVEGLVEIIQKHFAKFKNIFFFLNKVTCNASGGGLRMLGNDLM